MQNGLAYSAPRWTAPERSENVGTQFRSLRQPDGRRADRLRLHDLFPALSAMGVPGIQASMGADDLLKVLPQGGHGGGREDPGGLSEASARPRAVRKLDVVDADWLLINKPFKTRTEMARHKSRVPLRRRRPWNAWMVPVQLVVETRSPIKGFELTLGTAAAVARLPLAQTMSKRTSLMMLGRGHVRRRAAHDDQHDCCCDPAV